MNYLSRREKLINSINEGTIILFSGYEILRSADECYPFSVNRNFFYLTGINQKETYCVLSKEYDDFYILENDEKLARWVGYNLFPEEVKSISNCKNVNTYNDINCILEKIAKENKIIYLDLEKTNYLGGVNQGERLKNLLLSYNSNLEIRDIHSNIMSLRAIKDEEEIEALKESIKITKLALEKVMIELPTLKNEKEVQALFEQQIATLGFATTSFDTIAASGKNATILHYSSNKDVFKNEDMILLDLGARYNYYNADISRTYPHLGVYSSKQKELYEIVLSCNKEIINTVKPGVTIKELQEKTKKLLSKGLLEIGLIKNEEDLNEFYFHNVSHHLGLDTHDPMNREIPLVAGNVITVEPGLYIKEFGIGIRIEDDILVTENGSENLSKDIIKEVKDIENFFKENN